MAQRAVSIRAPVRGVARRAYEGHEKIYEAIAAHDAEAADAAMSSHLTMVLDSYWKAIAAKTK